MIDAIVISRRDDVQRRARIVQSIPANLNWSFLDATDGHCPESISGEYRAIFPKAFWGGTQIKPGAFGCFVSHYRAWLACAKLGRPVVIVEDDVVFGDYADDLNSLCSASRFDVLFMNRRMVNWLRLYKAFNKIRFLPTRLLREKIAMRLAMDEQGNGPRSDVEHLSVREIVEGILRADLVPPNQDAPGGDCYLVTPDGARGLIGLANSFGAVVGVDWFILGSAIMGMNCRSRWVYPNRVARYIRDQGSLSVGVTNVWVTETVDADVGGSTIKHSILVNLDEYRERLNAAP